MPIFEYVCGACGHQFEILVRTSGETGSEPCPICSARDVSRKFSVFGFRTASGRLVSSASCSAGASCDGCGGSCRH